MFTVALGLQGLARLHRLLRPARLPDALEFLGFRRLFLTFGNGRLFDFFRILQQLTEHPRLGIQDAVPREILHVDARLLVAPDLAQDDRTDRTGRWRQLEPVGFLVAGQLIRLFEIFLHHVGEGERAIQLQRLDKPPELTEHLHDL